MIDCNRAGWRESTLLFLRFALPNDPVDYLLQILPVGREIVAAIVGAPPVPGKGELNFPLLAVHDTGIIVPLFPFMQIAGRIKIVHKRGPFLLGHGIRAGCNIDSIPGGYSFGYYGYRPLAGFLIPYSLRNSHHPNNGRQ